MLIIGKTVCRIDENSVLSSQIFYKSKINLNLNLENKVYLKNPVQSTWGKKRTSKNGVSGAVSGREFGAWRSHLQQRMITRDLFPTVWDRSGDCTLMRKLLTPGPLLPWACISTYSTPMRVSAQPQLHTLSEAFANSSDEVRCLLALFPAASTLSLHTFFCGGWGVVRILFSALSCEAVNFTKAGSMVFRRQQVLNTNMFINQLTREFQG